MSEQDIITFLKFEAAILSNEGEAFRAMRVAEAARDLENADRRADAALEELAQLRAELARANSELNKWRNWHPDREDLKSLQEQARARDGSYTNGLAAQAAYIGGLEGALRDAFDENNAKLLAIAEVVAALWQVDNLTPNNILIEHSIELLEKFLPTDWSVK